MVIFFFSFVSGDVLDSESALCENQQVRQDSGVHFLVSRFLAPEPTTGSSLLFQSR